MTEIQVKMNGPDPYLGPRLAVGAAVFILYFVHYVILVFQAKGSAEVKEYVVKRIYLYSLAALLSITFIQGSTFCAVLAWFTLIPFILLHLTSFRDSFQGLQDKKDALWLAFYFLLFIWYFGLIIQFYILPDPLT